MSKNTILPVPARRPFELRDGKHKRIASGVTIHAADDGVWLTYIELDGRGGDAFRLPNDRQLLRELGKALLHVASSVQGDGENA